MATNNTYLDWNGLQLYHSKLKESYLEKKISKDSTTSEMTTAALVKIKTNADGLVTEHIAITADELKTILGDVIDTKNTAGNTNNTTSKGYLVFTTNANSTASEQTYKRTTLYIGSDNYLVATGFNATSDKRLKENIEDFNTVQSILNLPIKRFDYIDGPKNQIGCLAQDLQELYPELVTEDENGYLSIKESKLVYLLIDEVKKLKKEVEELKGEK